MKKIFLALTVLGIAAAASTAQAGVRFSIGFPAPVVYPARAYYPVPQTVYVQPAPVYVAPAPVVCETPTVVVAPPPVIYAPRPIVRFGFDHFGPFYRPGRW